MASKQAAPGNCSRALFSLRPSGRQAGPTVGHLIPAGTGIYRYHDIEIQPPEGFQPPTPPVEAALCLVRRPRRVRSGRKWKRSNRMD